MIDIWMREEVVHVEEDVEELCAHAAVPEQRVDGVVPAQQSVAVGQRLGRLVVRSHTDKNKWYGWSGYAGEMVERRLI